MKRLLIAVTAILLAFALAGCASDPAFNSGKIVDRFYQPERDWDSWDYTTDCGLQIDGKYTCGTPHFKWVHHHQYEEHQFLIENCQVTDKNGNVIVKKDGSEKCFKKWIDVDSSTYGQYKVGDNYSG